MAVEIKELVIRAVLIPEQGPNGYPAAGMEAAVNKEQLIQECVDQVMKIIKKSKQR